MSWPYEGRACTQTTGPLMLNKLPSLLTSVAGLPLALLVPSFYADKLDLPLTRHLDSRAIPCQASLCAGLSDLPGDLAGMLPVHEEIVVPLLKGIDCRAHVGLRDMRHIAQALAELIEYVRALRISKERAGAIAHYLGAVLKCLQPQTHSRLTDTGVPRGVVDTGSAGPRKARISIGCEQQRREPIPSPFPKRLDHLSEICLPQGQAG